MTDTQVVWLTQESYDKLKAELDQLIAHRPIIAAEINDRREEGDLRENGGYHAAREQQGQEEARIRQFQELLNTAKVGEAPKQSGVALPGSVVKVVLRRRQVRHGDVPDRHPPGSRRRREPRGVLAEFAARFGAAAGQGGRNPLLHRSQRQERQGQADQRRAVPRLAGVPAWRRSPRTCCCCCWTTSPAQPRLRPAALGRVLAAALLLDLAHDCRVRPAIPGDAAQPGTSGGAGRSGADGPRGAARAGAAGTGPITAAAAIAALRKRAEDDVLDQLLRTGQIHQIQLSSHRLRRNTYAWPMHNRRRVDGVRGALNAALFAARPPQPVDSGGHRAVAYDRRSRRRPGPRWERPCRRPGTGQRRSLSAGGGRDRHRASQSRGDRGGRAAGAGLIQAG